MGIERKAYRISVVSRAYCWSSLVRTSLTSVGVPENALRTKLKYLILSSVTGTFKTPKYVDAYRQKSFRHTPSLGVSTSHSQPVGLSQVHGLAVQKLWHMPGSRRSSSLTSVGSTTSLNISKAKSSSSSSGTCHETYHTL